MLNESPDKKKISVCFVSPKGVSLYLPEAGGVIGGAEVDLYLLGTELAKDAGFSVGCVVADRGQGVVEEAQGVQLYRSVDFNRNPLSGAWRIWRALKQADADLYVIKTASAGVPLVRAFCRRYGRRFVYRTAHTDEVDGTYRREHPLLGRLFERSLRKADAVLAQNESDADMLRQRLGIEAIVLPNAHRMPELVEGRMRDCILWVGRSTEFKRPGLFLDLAKAFPEESFVMICQQATGDTGYAALVEAAGGIANLRFIERVDFHEMGQWFSRAKVLVNTSRAEGFPNTFIQACQWATPILSLRVNPDLFLAQHLCGVACDGRIDRLEKGLRFLLEDQRYVELGRNGRAYAEQRHDVARIVEEYKRIFRGLVAAE